MWKKKLLPFTLPSAFTWTIKGSRSISSSGSSWLSDFYAISRTGRQCSLAMNTCIKMNLLNLSSTQVITRHLTIRDYQTSHHLINTKYYNAGVRVEWQFPEVLSDKICGGGNAASPGAITRVQHQPRVQLHTSAVHPQGTSRSDYLHNQRQLQTTFNDHFELIK